MKGTSSRRSHSRMSTMITMIATTMLLLVSILSSSSSFPRTHAFVAPSLLLRPMVPKVSTSQLTLPYQICPECDIDQEALARSIGRGIIGNVVDSHYLPQEVHPLATITEATIAPTIIPSPTTPQQVQDTQQHFTLDDVQISLLPSDSSSDAAPFKSQPLVVSPKMNGNDSLEFLQAFLASQRSWLDRQMLHYGAVLFRGFDIQTSSDMEAAIQSYQPNLNNQYRGTSPRDVQTDTKFIFSAAEAPSYFPIAQHIEMSFLPSPPKQLFFSALQAPKTAGGETALADFRKVYQDIKSSSPRLFEKLLTKKLKYTRTHSRRGARWTHDVAAMQGWPDVFGTSDKAEVEKMAEDEKLSMRWEGRNKDRFVSEYVSDAFQLHPQSKQPVWFNHAQVFHPTSFPAELLAAFRRTKQWRLLWHALRVTAFSVVWYGLLRRKMALHVTFGDGSDISPWEMQTIRRAIHRNMVFNRWQKGDLLMIDNFSTSHGRQPTYDKGRKVVVAWSDPIEKANMLSTADDVAQYEHFMGSDGDEGNDGENHDTMRRNIFQ